MRQFNVGQVEPACNESQPLGGHERIVKGSLIVKAEDCFPKKYQAAFSPRQPIGTYKKFTLTGLAGFDPFPLFMSQAEAEPLEVGQSSNVG